jgi:WD repeat-containing protein 34
VEPDIGDAKVPSTVSTEHKGLCAFIKSVGPIMEAELALTLSSSAFDDYDVVWEDERDQIHKLQSLTNEKKKGAGFATSCSKVAWNCTGSLIAACYGERTHVGWCDHKSTIAAWNIMSRRLNQAKPEIEIELSACASALAFHPKHPTMLAVGLFSGEIRVLDVNNTEEPLVANSSIDDYFHREPIAQLAWTRGIRGEYTLVSISGDGKVLFWKMSNKLAHPVAGASIKPTSQYHGHGERRNQYKIMGGTAMSFSSLDFTNYVIGTEGGGVLKCQRPRPVQITKNRKVGNYIWSPAAFQHLQGLPQQPRFEIKNIMEKYATKHGIKKVDLASIFAARPDPSKVFPQASRQVSLLTCCRILNLTHLFVVWYFGKSFDKHSGPVYSIHPSPFHRNLFLTCSTDGTLRLYNMLKVPHLLSEPKFSASNDTLCFLPGSASFDLYGTIWKLPL